MSDDGATHFVTLPPEVHGGVAPSGPLRATRPLDLAGPKRVAIVGSRVASAECLHFAAELASILAARGAIVVSGGALGIDAAAHEGALAAGGITWVALPSGYPNVFPPENVELFERVRRSRGALLWTMKDGALPLRPHFLTRNGVLVALSSAVVVVAAGIKSGARNAAGWARKLGRRLYVVAGPPWLPEFSGTMLELVAGARPILSTVELVRDLLGDPSQTPPDPRYHYIFQHLCAEPLHFDVLVERSAADPAKLRAHLVELCLEGRVQEIAGSYKVVGF